MEKMGAGRVLVNPWRWLERAEGAELALDVGHRAVHKQAPGVVSAQRTPTRVTEGPADARQGCVILLTARDADRMNASK